MKVWVTKYALSEGILELDAALYKTDGMQEYVVVRNERFPCRTFFCANEWHYTKEAAIARAEEMRIKKLQSLNKQIKKLSALKFE